MNNIQMTNQFHFDNNAKINIKINTDFIIDFNG